MAQQERTTLDMKGISIEFPGVKALSDVDFQVESGRIHALIGANGAGKSTLMKVLSGAYSHYTGSIHLNGNQVTIRTPRDAKELGIDIVYQEVDTALIPYLDVAENIMLDVMVNRMKGKVFINWKHIHDSARKVLERLGIQLDTRKRVQDLTLAQKQMVLIARAIAEERRFLILDEPTAPLSHKETDELFRVVRELANHQNVGIIFISHRLPELFEICEEITIMRDGQVVTRNPIAELTTKQVVEWMLGRKMDETYVKKQTAIGEPLLTVSHLYDRKGMVRNVSLHVRAGEIVGIAGLVGAGKTELCKTIFGAHAAQSGEIKLKEKKLQNKTPHAAVKQGLALVPEERRKEGVLVDESVVSNLSAASLGAFSSAFGFVKPREERAAALKMIGDLGIKTPHENQKVALLSGGNQQKVAVGKWLLADADVYMFDEPTKGVDVGAKRDIFNLIAKLAEIGKGSIYATSELSEILAITDRIYVMYDGAVVKELLTSETTEEEILYYSTGGN
ncbi:sugar ABC transporter ATP-binding protein [Brevibacillus fluminis]|uniref:Sugar ABC transporter ATP-binding protein n=1 Tax=Brevibacillus fluminis TaxID=511487 RepID=A0A3M8DSC2_9BACL|nr:sugar ABC transporter ATP-binding protein [Brevibacillus fluminis]RNB90351.1 sugar ABC transporter ATP-binding protein [Brevibacillus fluminis]